PLFDAGDIAQAYRIAADAGDDDGTVLVRRGEFAEGANGELLFHAFDATGGDGDVLTTQGSLHVGDSQSVGGQTGTVDPDANGESLLPGDQDLGDARQLGEPILDLGLGDGGEVDLRVVAAVEGVPHDRECIGVALGDHRFLDV